MSDAFSISLKRFCFTTFVLNLVLTSSFISFCSNSTAKLFEEDAIKKIPKNENIIQACSPKQICEYFVLAQTLNIHNEPYKESTIKKETQRMRDKYNLLQSGVDPHTYRLQSF